MSGPIPKNLLDIIFDLVAGDVQSNKPLPAPLPFDARTAALRTLSEYLSALTFYKAGAVGGPPVAFKFKPEQILIEWPDNPESMVMPSLAFQSVRASLEPIGLAPSYDESSAGKFGAGTILRDLGCEYIEQVMLEGWVTDRADRRAIARGLPFALSPLENMYGLRLIVPDYYDAVVRFSPKDIETVDDEMSAKGRRRVRMGIEMVLPMIHLVNIATMTTKVDVEVVEADDYTVTIGV